MREQAIQTAIMKWLGKSAGFWFKVISANRNGIPDIMGGRTLTITQDMVGSEIAVLVGLEVKTATGRPSELQLYNIEKIQKAGGIAGVVRSLEDAKLLIDNLGPHVRMNES